MVLGRIRDWMSWRGCAELDNNNGFTEEAGRRSSNKSYMRLSSSLQDLSSYSQTSSVALTEKKKKKPKWALAIITLCAVCVLSVLVVVAVAMSSNNSKFYVVLDSGSTGTRVYVYEATPAPDPSSSALPFLIANRNPPRTPLSGRAYHRMETEPGFHKLLHNASALRSAIKPLLRWAQNQIPPRSHKYTSLFLYATAGLRRLPPAHSKWLLDTAWPVLRASPFISHRDWLRVISGTEEAYFGWIALNHATHVLGSRPRKPTFGALDLGGSSLQVTFESDRHNETSLNLRIGSVNHHLTAYSLSGYGLNDAFDKSVARLVRDQDQAKPDLSVKHPCLQSGYTERYTCSQCGSRVTLIGAPDWDQCASLAKVAVNVSEWSNVTPGVDCNLQPCALSDGLPRPYGQFYAMSGFYVVFRFFNLTSSEATLDDVLEKGRGFCERSWEEARSSVAPQPFIEQYCFRAPYVVSLLREGLHIAENQIIIGSGSVTWTLGVALLEAGNAFSTTYQILDMKNINPPAILILALVVVSLILLGCAILWVGNWMPKFLRRATHHLPLFRHTSGGSVPSVLRFQRWSPINSGDGRAKMPLSPTIGGERAFGFGFGDGRSNSSAEIQLMEASSSSSLYTSTSCNNLGQMQLDGLWTPHRTQMGLQSRRSQSREDLNSSLSEAHMVKV